MRGRRRNPWQQHGFTLLELLISITLLGLILVLLFGGLRLGLRSWDAAQIQVDSINAVRSVESFLRREITAAYPYRWKEVPGQRLAFLGERYKISFVAPMPARIGGGGLNAISFELEPAGQRMRLVWRVMPVTRKMQDFSELAQAQATVLAAFDLNGVQDIRLGYFGSDAAGAPPRWLDRWENALSLPLLIRLQFKMAQGADWSGFVVAPILSSEVTR
jgi:general secretion pathway protein J